MTSEETAKLKEYYEKYYPFKEMTKLFNLDEKRELSFTLENDVYIRYITVDSQKEFKKEVCDKVPVKFDIGAIYESKPIKKQKNTVLKKELVFDIDLTDYPRNCCEGKNICEECFTIIKVSVELLNYILSYEFGFKKINFFFSGGRGLHCWVSDEEAMSLNDLERISISSFINYVNIKGIPVDEYIDIIRKYYDSRDYKELIEKYFLKLDAKVTNDINHLLKAPFCIHPSSKKVCVALNPEKMDDLFLNCIPSLDEVIKNPEIMNEFIKNINL